MTNAGSGDHPGVIARPTRIYPVSIAVGVALELLWPLPVIPPALARWLGIPVLLAGVAFFVLGVREFRRAETNVPTYLPALRIVHTGPYRVTRNPIYLGMTLFQLGLALWVNSAWLLCTLVVALVLMNLGVIAREERYLERKFGDEYLRYKREVRRWL